MDKRYSNRNNPQRAMLSFWNPHRHWLRGNAQRRRRQTETDQRKGRFPPEVRSSGRLGACSWLHSASLLERLDWGVPGESLANIQAPIR